MEKKTIRTRLSGKKRLVVAAGALLGVAALATSAAYTDIANLNLGNGTDGSGIGNPNKFDVAVVLPDNTVEEADTEAGYDWNVPLSDQLIPGGTISTDIPIFNNTENMKGAIDFAVELRNGDGAVSPTVPNITQFLRFSASVDGAELFSDVEWDDAEGSLGEFAERNAAALAQGAAYVAGDAGSAKTLTLEITYVDAPETVDYNGGQSALRVHFDATSVN